MGISSRVVLAIRLDGYLLWYRYTGDGTAGQTLVHRARLSPCRR
jgi:hypothetical protein